MSKLKKTQLEKDPDYLLRMSHAASSGTASGWLMMLPILLFGAVTILIVRMHVYTRPMSQFFWTSETDESQLTEFFSYNKMVFLLIMAGLALLLIIFGFISQSMAIKRTWLYIPMGVYTAFVIISYLFSTQKEFALLGYNERFEGTLPLIAYMLMVFFIINTVNDEKNIKWVFWAIAISSVILSLLGISQAADHDFFRTLLGQKLITPNYDLEGGTTMWQQIEAAFEKGELFFNFTFNNREAYQTVYNINYVSFYLTLLIPLFGMLFIHAFGKESGQPKWKIAALAVLFGLNVFNFIYSASAGGFFGLGVIVIVAIILFNKQLKDMLKPLIILVVIAGIIFSFTTEKWLPQVKSIFAVTASEAYAADPASVAPYIDYFKTEGDDVKVSLNQNELTMTMTPDGDGADTYSLNVYDAEGNPIALRMLDDGYYALEDERFADYIKLALQVDEENQEYLVLNIGGLDFYFIHNIFQMVYLNGFRNQVVLDEVEAGLFKNDTGFGSNRGYIWSRSLPMLKHTIIKGYGADTYCINFPHQDYAGKYNTSWRNQIDIIVDKPHNMYINMGLGTGCISLLAIFALYGGYAVQSFKLLWKRKMGSDFINYAAAGIFFGTTAFMLTGIVNDSTVSTMPMFYTLFGTGIATNMIIKKRDRERTE